MYIDTHTHILDPKYDIDRELVITNADQKNIKILIEVAWGPELWNKAIDLSKASKNVYCTLGIHPHEAKIYTPELMTKLKVLCMNNAVLGVGETGLDYHYDNSPRDVQQQCFIEHIKLSKTIKKPLIVHCRDAYTDLRSLLLKEYSLGNKPNGIIHCFSGDIEDAKMLIDLGFLLGINGPVTYPNAKTLRTVVEKIDLKHLVIETDCPYLPPQQYRGKRNEPSYVIHIAEEISKIKNISLQAVEESTTNNVKEVFTPLNSL